MASLQFQNGHIAAWIQGDVALPQYVSKFFMELFGDGKSVQLYDRFKKATFSDGQNTWTEERDEEEGFQIENHEFIAALLEKRPLRSARMTAFRRRAWYSPPNAPFAAEECNHCREPSRELITTWPNM